MGKGGGVNYIGYWAISFTFLDKEKIMMGDKIVGQNHASQIIGSGLGIPVGT